MKTKKRQDLQPIKLLEPAFKDCATVFEALKKRRTSRSITNKKISLQMLSDILWAAQGINRAQGPFGIPGRTAASASNSQEISVYTALKEGIFLYKPVEHELTPVAIGDYRKLAIGAGQGNAGAEAPLRLVYVVDLEKYKSAGFQEPGLYDPEIQKSYYFVGTGLIAQNVYLASYSLGLASWFHNCNKPALTKKLKLKPQQRALFGQTIGYAED
jgi:nitroreductase